MIGPSLLVAADVGVGLGCLALVIGVAVIKAIRAFAESSRQARVAPYRAALLSIAADGDEDGTASAVLRGVAEREWHALRHLVVALLGKVRGDTAETLVRLLEARGEFERARAAIGSRLAIRRARAAYLLGLTRQRQDAHLLLLPLLDDRSSEVRLVAARSLGAVGDPAAAPALFRALAPVHGQPGIPTALAAEALLAFGTGAVPAVIHALGGGVTERAVATLVAAEGALTATAPGLRRLLADEPELDVRISAVRALGAIGGPDDVAGLAALTGAAQPRELRRAVVQALGELGHPAAAPVLSALLSDPDIRLAQHSGDALVRLGPAGVSALLDAAAGTGPGATAAAGSLAIARLRNVPLLPGEPVSAL